MLHAVGDIATFMVTALCNAKLAELKYFWAFCR